MPAQQSQQDLLDLFDRIYPVAYLGPMKDGTGPGYEFWRAVAAGGARTSEAVARLYAGAFILTASGGSRASGTITLTRATTGGGAVTIKAASIVVSTTTGARFGLAEDVAFGALDLTGTGVSSGLTAIEVVALGEGYGWNTPASSTAANGDVLPDDIAQFSSLVMEPAFVPGLDAPSPSGTSAGTTGGAFPWLDLLGSNRGLVRVAGEPDAAFRARLRSLVDTVSPGAVVRALDALLNPLGLAYTLRETFDLGYQTAYDGPTVDIPNPFSAIGAGSYAANLFAWDDPRPADPARNRWLDEADQFNSIVVVVANLSARSDVGMGYDDTAVNQAGLQTALGGERATCAYDVPDVAAGVSLQGGYDGFDLGKAAVYKGIHDVLAAVKPAGCNHYVELAGQ